MDEEIRIVKTLIVHDGSTRERLRSIYRVAFDEVNDRTPIHHGSYSDAEFDALLRDEDFTKYLVYADTRLIGLTLMTNILAKVPWVNAAYFAQRYPNRYRDRLIYFLPAVVIDPDYQDLRRIGAKLLQQTVTPLAEDAVLAVDYSETLRRSLPDFVRRGLGRTFQGDILDRLTYQAFYYHTPD